MKDIVQYISPLIESQFPSFYREEGTNFIAFAKAYYEWLEQSNNVTYHARNLLNYRDIDKTIDDFLVYFKEESLKNIQFDTATDKRLLVKNALDFYRSKGTERSIDLFFKLVYAQPAKVKYPGDDLFKLSDNSWKESKYIEISEMPYNRSYEGKQIYGLNSGAIAFAESFATKKKINNGFDNNGNPIKISKDVNILFLNNLVGNFVYGEKIVYQGLEDPRNAPTIVGSLNALEIVTGGSNYQIGDVVTLDSNTGLNGKAIVTSTSNTTGQVEFTLLEGGWGFTSNPQILISERVLLINSVSVSNTITLTPFRVFENLVQPKANIDFEYLTGTFQSNDYIYTYYANNSLAGTGKIISIDISSSNSTTGNVYVSLISGNLQANDTFYNSDNTVYANTTLYTDRTAKANIMAITSNADFLMNSVNSGILFTKGEKIFQSNSTVEWANAVIDVVVKNGANLLLSVSNVNGVFLPNNRTYGLASGADANLYSYNTRLGIIDFSSTTVSAVNIVANGSGYSNGEVVSFTSNTGYGAAARIYTSPTGAIANVLLYDSGKGYLTAPTTFISNTVDKFFFNANTDVSNTSNFITLVGHNFVNAQAIKYSVTIGSTPLSGLSNNSTYYVKGSNSSGITISTTPAGSIIAVTSGLSQNGHSFSSIATSGVGASLVSVLGKEFDIVNETFVYGEDTGTTALISQAGQGSLANFKVISLDDQETVNVSTDFVKGYNFYGAKFLDIKIDGSSNSALSGSNSYGFPGNPGANLTSGTLSSTLSFAQVDIGSISLISTVSPGSDYTLDPLVNILEPYVYGYNKKDYIIKIEGSTESFASKENLLYSNNNINFSALAKIKNVIDANTIVATRTSLFGNISEYGNNYIKGETSNFSTKIVSIQQANTTTGFNAQVLTDVITANGVAAGLSVLDSGFGYERLDILSFSNKNNLNSSPGIAKAIVEIQGTAEGFYQNNKGFLSSDKYLHDGDYYQEYSYEIISRIPFTRYFEMLKKVLHVAGTKMFPAVELESSASLGLGATRSIEIYKSFNPSVAVNTTSDFITISDNIFANTEAVVYTTSTGNTAINGLSNNESYFIAYANTSGFKLSTTANGSTIVNLTGPLPNEVGHEIHNII